MSSNIVNVLLVIDVQNCFISGGSLGSDPSQLEISKKQMREILELMRDNDHIYFTRDYHPINHMSLESTAENRKINYATIFPNHCRNKNSTCPKRPGFNITSVINNVSRAVGQTNFTDKEITSKPDTRNIGTRMEWPIIGTDLSYLYLVVDNEEPNKYTSYVNGIVKLVEDGHKPKPQHTIGLINYKENNKEPDLKNINYNGITGIPIDGTTKKIYQLTKGEFCDYESYSAFNYHLHFTYDTKKNVVSAPLNLEKKYSTGLWENILGNITNNDTNSTKTVNITVCGLVGNICVMNSVHNGIALWKKFYKNEYPNVTVNFIYSFPGTLFLPNSVFNLTEAVYQDLDKIEENIIGNIEKDFEKVVGSIESTDRVTLKFKIIDKFYDIKLKQTGGSYYNKYLKYKQKYLKLRNQLNN
jgi:nicotinamidase-related amidase